MRTLSTLSLLVLVALLAFAGCANPFLSDDQFAWNEKVRLETRIVMSDNASGLQPAVIFAAGSSPVDFEDYTPGYRETFLAGVFHERGYAVTYYNKRGIGESTGNWKWSSIEERAEDLLSVVEYVRSQPGIDPERIGIVGHSQGGWVVQLAGSMDDSIAFVVSLAGPTVSVREQDSHGTESYFRCDGYSEEEIAEELEKLETQHERKIAIGSWFPFFQLRYSANIYVYDPREAISDLTQPTLLAYGESDPLVPVEPNLVRFREIFPSGPPANFTWHVVSGGDHSFHVTNSPCVDYYEALEYPYSEDFVTFLGSWVDGLGI
jgi:uncharacterized protein